jgi:phage-related minor tail protein
MAKDAGKLDELERGLVKPAELFEELLESIKDAPDILAATTLASEAFGSRVGAKVAEDIRAGRFEVEAFADEVAGVSGVVRDTAAATETFKDRMGILKNETLLVGEAFGETLLPFVEQGLEKFKELQKRFAELSPEQREQIVRFLAIAAAIGPVLIVVGKLVSGIGSLIKASVALGKAMMFLATNPVGLTILAIAALIAIGVAVYKNWDTIKERASAVWGSVKESVVGAFEGIKNAVRPIVNSILGYYNALISGVEAAINAVAGAINRIPPISIPKWVPIFGGNSYSVPNVPNVSFPRIPMLADGGIVTRQTLAVIGEAGPEAVIPLDRLDQAAGGDTYVINVSGALDSEGVARQIERILRDSQRRTGGVLV